jgi:hypothetical protein
MLAYAGSSASARSTDRGGDPVAQLSRSDAWYPAYLDDADAVGRAEEFSRGRRVEAG